MPRERAGGGWAGCYASGIEETAFFWSLAETSQVMGKTQ